MLARVAKSIDQLALPCMSSLSHCDSAAGHEAGLRREIDTVEKDWANTPFGRCLLTSFWFLVFVVVIVGTVTTIKYRFIDSASFIALAFGIIGVSSNIYGYLDAHATRKRLGLARLKFLKRKLQTDASGSIRKVLADDTHPLVQHRDLSLILANYTNMYAEVLEYMNGGVQSWAWK